MPRRHLQDTLLLLLSRTVAARGMERCFSMSVPEFRAARPQTNASATGGKGDRGQGSRRAERNQSADGAVGGKSGKEETGR